MLTVLNRRKNGVVHDFHQDAVLPKDLALLEAKDDDPRVLDRMKPGLKETFNHFQVCKLTAQ